MFNELSHESSQPRAAAQIHQSKNRNGRLRHESDTIRNDGGVTGRFQVQVNESILDGYDAVKSWNTTKYDE